MLALAKLKNKSKQEIKNHLATEYCGERHNNEGSPTPDDIREVLKAYDILIAYENMDGYKAVSWFLLKETDTGEFFMITGAYDSCVGFRGQFKLENTCPEYLTDPRFYFETGNEINGALIKVTEYIKDIFSDTPEYFNKDPVLDLRYMETKSESAIKNHIAGKYCGMDCDELGSGFDFGKIRTFLEEYDILVAYENGDYERLSSSPLWTVSWWFLLRDQKTDNLFILSGDNHQHKLSNQFKLEKTSASELANLRIELEMSNFDIRYHQVNMKIENYLKNMFDVDDPLPDGP